MPTQTELILRVQALGTEQIEKLDKLLDGLEKTTTQWSASQQRAAMRMAGVHEEALKLNAALDAQRSGIDKAQEEALRLNESYGTGSRRAGEFADTVGRVSTTMARSADTFGLPVGSLRALDDAADIAEIGLNNLSKAAAGFNTASLGVAGAGLAIGAAIGTAIRNFTGLGEWLDKTVDKLTGLTAAEAGAAEANRKAQAIRATNIQALLGNSAAVEALTIRIVREKENTDALAKASSLLGIEIKDVAQAHAILAVAEAHSTEGMKKAAEQAKKTADEHRKLAAEAKKAALNRALAAVEANKIEIDAYTKYLNAAAAGEKDLTAKVRGEVAARFVATEASYRKMAAEAARYFQHVIDGATRSGGTEVQQAQSVLDKVKAMRADLVESHRATNEQMQQSDEALAAAEEDLEDKKREGKVANFLLIAESASSILRSLWGKSKAAAIAAAIIDTIAAIVKTMAAYPWPWNLIPAAAAAAAGYAQVDKIRSQEAGFRTGTPGTSFVDFGRGSMEMLHGQEAVVTRGQADSVAAMVKRSIEDANRRAGERSTMPAASRDGEAAIILDGEVVGRWFKRRNRAGLLPVMVR